MERIAEYVLRLTCGAILCSLLHGISGSDGPGARIRQIVSALTLVFLAISPLKELDLEDFRIPEAGYAAQGEYYAAQGREEAQRVFSELISEQYISYIQSRAAVLSLSPEVSVALNESTGAPIAVTLICEATPYERSRLTEEIHQNLGIERSSIHWNP